MIHPPEHWMELAIAQGHLAKEAGEVPVGCVLVRDNQLVAEGRNHCEEQNSPVAHAEIKVITQGCAILGQSRLSDCVLYVTLEPCAMCVGAIIHARIPRVYFGAYESKMGCCGSVLNLFEEPLGHRPRLYGGILEPQCRALMQSFFRGLREEKEESVGATDSLQGISSHYET